MKHSEGKWILKPGRNKHYVNKVEGRDYEATMQNCYYMHQEDHISNFIADIIVSRSPIGVANAHRIKQCVNNFDKLLDACKAMLSSFREVEAMTWAYDLCKQAEQAIAEAEEG